MKLITMVKKLLLKIKQFFSFFLLGLKFAFYMIYCYFYIFMLYIFTYLGIAFVLLLVLQPALAFVAANIATTLLFYITEKRLTKIETSRGVIVGG